jgi:hypothetical protein
MIGCDVHVAEDMRSLAGVEGYDKHLSVRNHQIYNIKPYVLFVKTKLTQVDASDSEYLLEKLFFIQSIAAPLLALRSFDTQRFRKLPLAATPQTPICHARSGKQRQPQLSEEFIIKGDILGVR